MKKVMLLSMAILMVVFAYAQEHSPAEKRALRMKETLNLNDQQYASIVSINRKYAGERSVLRERTDRDKTAAMRDLRKRWNDDVNQVLTTEQQEKWTSVKKEQRAARHEHKKHRRDSFKELTLTDDQKVKLKAANKNFHGKREQLKKENKLDDASRKQLREEHKREIKSILTDEQYTKMKAMKTSHKRKHHRR